MYSVFLNANEETPMSHRYTRLTHIVSDNGDNETLDT